MIYKPFDIVIVPFPFSENANSKKRPAIILSSALAFNADCNHTVLAMITSAEHYSWPLDTPIVDLVSANLSKKSIVRMKLFTLDNQLILRKLGTLGTADQKKLQANLKKLFAVAL